MKRVELIAAYSALACLASACTTGGDDRGDSSAGMTTNSVTTSATATDSDSTAGTTSDTGVTGTGTSTTTSTTGSGSGGTSDSGGIKFDTLVDDAGDLGCNVDLGCTDKIDLLFVIDNSGTMGEEQLNLAKNFPLLIQRLEELEDSDGKMVNPDVQIMVTTTDFGNPLCSPFQKHPPEKGAPIATGCNARIDRFTGLTNPPVVLETACTDVCPADVEPTEDFIHFWGPASNENNVPDVPDADINGDAIPDSEVAQALACIGPQGIDGCGYESPLENMLQALNPGQPWNSGAAPFLRDEALLALVLVTDEADCSIKDFSILTDTSFHETDPDTNTKKTSSALCWNAGVSCTGPDVNGVYSNCASTNNDKLQPTTRYTDYLIKELREKQKKEIIMLGILGVPEVTAHNPEAPYEPTAGGVFDLVYRDWIDGQYPGGDILPAEWAAGVTAANKEFDFGIGPGCTGEDGGGGFTGQAIPPVRIKEVCEALNIDKGNGVTDVRCCIESICDTDFSAAIGCLTGIISETIKPPG